MKKLLTLLLAFAMCMPILAQRVTDQLDRGLVAVAKSTGGVFCSWRVLAEEYYDVTYNIYRDGTKLNDTPLSVSNYTDDAGTSSSTYTVKAVINNEEQAACDPVSVLSTQDGNKNSYLKIQMQDVVDRNGDIVFCCCGSHTPSSDVAQNYTLNDCSMADLDGDGELEIIVKRINASDASSADAYSFNSEIYSTTNTRAFVHLDAYKLDGTRLWWIDCGPNMVSLNSTEIDIIAYDWDEDGKAEVVLRGADNMIIHEADGSTYTVGDASVNTRNAIKSHSNAQYAWTHTGAEYLIYMNGTTGVPYQVIDYPLPRFESDESGKTEQQVWSPTNSSGGYGHRSSKYFFGAPVLDGRHASIFLGRGIYTQTKMCALDVNRSTHALTTRWTWRCNTVGSTWFGQGYHNFSVADVDGDGCDEIIYGSMVIDNNGKGLSTTGLGHGDSQHVGDFDPYRKGMEVFACNEDDPANNYRDATTSKIYHRDTASEDDGRALMDNFTNKYPGSVGRSVNCGMVSSVTDNVISELGGNSFIDWADLNWRIYWDGDLCSEFLESPGTEGYAVVYKPGTYARLLSADITKLNNDSKNNPCFTGDILGDWREEIVARNGDDKSLCIYTTTTPTSYRVPCLWFDPEYRQAMVWQMCAYNQTPHVSFFMGEMEGLTKVPVPLTMTGRTEVASSGDCIPTSANSQEVIAYGLANIGIPTAGASPSVLTIDVPSTVSGNDDNDNITSSYSTSQLGYGSYKGDLTGNMHLVKQGDGLLKITAKTFAYTGRTDVYAGSVYFRGTLTNSPVWMNRHTTLYTAGTYNRAVTMEYGSTLNLNYSDADGTTEYSTATIDTLNLHEGARVIFDIDQANSQTDVLNMKHLSIRKQNWSYGPTYSAPVFEVTSTASLPIGNYLVGTANTIDGDLEDITIEGTSFASGTHQKLISADGNIYIKVYDENEDFIGTSDNTTAFKGDFSNSYTIKSGYTYNFKFTNYSLGSENYQNWNLVVANGTGHSTDDRSDYEEYFLLRADQYGWGDYYNTTTLALVGGTYDWATFRTDMAKGADVDMNVTFANSIISVDATITSTTGNVYTYTFTSKEISEEEVTAYFTVDNSHMTIPVKTVAPYSNVRMTYVNYDSADTSYGEVTTATSGYNKISGGAVGFANSTWGANYITYLQLDLSSYKNVDVNVNSIYFSFNGTGSIDNARSTGWGIGYNSSTWSSTMTYNTADKSITTIGSVQYGGTKSATAYNTFSWDITDAFNADEDGILTILVYETAAAGAYITEPSVSADFSIVEDPEDETEVEPSNKIAGTTTTYDFKQIYSNLGYTAATWLNLGTDETIINKTSCVNSTDDGTDGLVFQNEASTWRLTNAGLREQARNTRTIGIPNLKTGDIITVVGAVSGTATNVVTVNTGNATTTASDYTYTITMTADGNLGLTVARTANSNYYTIESITIKRASRVTLEPKSTDSYSTGIYDYVTVNRNFNAGYSSLCVPFNTTISEFTGRSNENEKAYYLTSATESDGTYTLTFTKTTEIKANRPYLIYLTEALSAPTLSNKAVFAEDAKTLTCDGWSMIGNYTVGLSLTGLYGVANNSSIKKGSSTAYVNGLTAYLSGPSGAKAKAAFSDLSIEDTPTLIQQASTPEDVNIIGIYSIDGRCQESLAPGMNIIRMSDGSVRKVYVKH